MGLLTGNTACLAVTILTRAAQALPERQKHQTPKGATRSALESEFEGVASVFSLKWFVGSDASPPSFPSPNPNPSCLVDGGRASGVGRTIEVPPFSIQFLYAPFLQY